MPDNHLPQSGLPPISKSSGPNLIWSLLASFLVKPHKAQHEQGSQLMGMKNNLIAVAGMLSLVLGQAALVQAVLVTACTIVRRRMHKVGFQCSVCSVRFPKQHRLHAGSKLCNHYMEYVDLHALQLCPHLACYDHFIVG